MQNRTALLTQLAQAVEQLQANYHPQKRNIVYTKFDPMLFSENFQPLEFYFNELNYTLFQLRQFGENDLAQTAFFSEKLLAQCTALSDALNKPSYQELQSAVNFQPKLNAREQRRQAL